MTFTSTSNLICALLYDTTV